MTPRTVAALALATTLLIAIAAFAMHHRDSATAATTGSGERLFPELEGRLNDVSAITVAHADGTFTLERGEDGWGMREKRGYPADGAKARALLFALSGAELLERKTANPDWYSKVGVEGVEAPEAESIEVILADAGAGELASLIVGNRHFSKGGSSSQAWFVRKPSEEAAWLVEGELTVAKEEKQWLDQMIVDIERDRIKSARIVHADGEVVVVNKPEKDATEYELLSVPEGKEVSYPTAPGVLASGLVRVTMEDVMPAGEITFTDPPFAVTTFWTYGGLKVTVATHLVTDGEDEKLYATLEAAYDEAGGPAELAESGPPAPAEESEDAGNDEPAEDTAEAGPTPDEIREEAEAIRAKVIGWTYEVPAWKKSTFAKRLDELVKDVEPAPEEEAAPEEPLEEADDEGAVDESEELLEEAGDEGALDESGTPGADEAEEAADEGGNS